MGDLKIDDKVNLIVPKKFQVDRLPKGLSYKCKNCDDTFTIHRDPPFVIYPVETDSFEEGYICHCGQRYHIKNKGKHKILLS